MRRPGDPAVSVERGDAVRPHVPASAQPVDDRVSFGELEGVAEVDEDRQGDIYFVTISEPQQSVLSWWVPAVELRPPARALEPEIDFLTRDEKYGTQTPTQRRQISLQMMRTSSQVAQYVALQALGYEDASIVPGRGRRRRARVPRARAPTACTTYAPGRRGRSTPATRIAHASTASPLDTVDDLVAAARRQAARRHRRAGDRPARTRARRPSRSS